MATKKRPPKFQAGNQAARVVSVGARGATTARSKSVPARVQQPSDKVRKVR